jgi:phosphoglycolate phosphatase-like HAD superfamily hydrolase
MRLILFDIDGTLLDCGRQVRPLLAGALVEVFGTAGAIDTYDFAGKPDPRIVLDLMTGAGVARQTVLAGLPRLRARYLVALEAGLGVERMRLLPGVREVLDRLVARPEVTLGLVTGNWEAGARIKLGRLGLNDYFAFGAFGDDASDRSLLPPIACARATAHTGREFLPREVLIVGDSLLDVECARHNGLRSLAVATGHTGADALAAAGADWVIADLFDAHRCAPVFSV